MDKNDYQGYYDSIWEEIEPHKRKGGNKKQKQTGIPVVIVIIVAAVLFLVFCRGVTPYSGRRDMRPGTVSVSDKTDNCVSPPVQDRLCWRMSLRHSILRDYVSGCGKIIIL